MSATSAIPQTLTDWYAGQTAGTPATVNGGVLSGSNPVTPISNSTPNTYSGLQNNGVSTQLGTPAQVTVTPQDTVQGQMSGILASGSPLMQQAQTTGNQSANARGLLNSNLSAGSAENSMIAAATPIATQDAATNFNADTANATSNNAFATANAANAFNAQANAFSTNAATATNLANNQMSQQNNLQAQIGAMNTQLNNDIATIQTSQTMDQQAKDYSIQQLQSAYTAQVSMLSAVGTVPDVTSLLTSANAIPGVSTATSPSADYVAAPAPAPTTPAPAASSGGGSVICTYYHDIGKMSHETYALDALYYEKLLKSDPGIVSWYWSWGVPFSSLLRENRLLSALAWPVINAWSKHMCHLVGKELDLNIKDNSFGKGIMSLGYWAYRLCK